VLVHLEARRFRNLAPLKQPFAPGSHLVLGGNGAGKTSLLEAVYLLATTRSFRTPRIPDCCRHGETQFEIVGEVDTDRRARLELEWRDGQRERSVNGRRTSLAEHLGALPIVCWTADDSEILVGPPAARRRFLDRGVLGLRPVAIEVMSRYRQALHEKRQLLQRGGKELGTWNQVLATAASELVAQRSAYAERLRVALAGILEECQLGLGAIEVRYRSSLRSGLDGPEAIVEELNAAGERERALQQPILGPHRDDLSIRWDGHALRRVASAGERKALGLALLAANGRILSAAGREPVYLLDDADTELDQERLTALWRIFSDSRQVFATSNRPVVWESVEMDHRWTCEAGTFYPQGKD
jgi:DNA replication and repair protein RecF